MSDVAKQMIYAKVLARDLQEAAQRNLQRNDKLIEILFDPDAELGEKYEAFYKLCGGPELQKIKEEALTELNMIYSCYMTLKAHADKVRQMKESNKDEIIATTFENKMRILKARFNNVLLRMLKVAFPSIAKTLWGIRGIAEEEARKKISWSFEEE